MEVVNLKSSNYIGQEEDNEKFSQHLTLVDKDLQNLRYELNKVIRYFRGKSFNDINLGSIGLGKGASAPGNVVISSTNIEVLGFDGGATTEQAYGTIELIHGYKEGTVIHPHIHWMPTTDGIGNVRWQLEYAITNLSSAIVSSTTIAVSSSATGIAWREIFTDFPEVSGTNLTIGNQICFRLFRVPTGVDNYADDAAVLTIGIHYEQDSLGSSEETSK